MTDKRKFKIAIIGTGGIARHHISAYLNQPDVEIVAAADLVHGKAEAFMQDYGVEGVRFYPSHKELIDNETELDGISICTYNTQHANVAIYALEHNIPVLLEKPFTVTIEEAAAVCKAEAKSEAFVSVGFQPRFDANMQMIGKIVRSGELGKIYYIQTGGGRRRGMPGGTFIRKDQGGIGALGDIGCYSLDMVLNALGYPKPLTVSGYTSSYFGTSAKYNPEWHDSFQVDDFGAGFIRLEGDIILDFRISWAMHADTMGDTIILGTDAALRIPAKKDECWNGTIGGPLVLYQSIAGKQVETVIPREKEIEGESNFDRKIRSFADAIKDNTVTPISIDEIIYNQAILSGIAESAELGHEIEIKLDL